MRLTPKGGVENRFKMLVYFRVCSAFESVFAVPLGVIRYFKDSFYLYKNDLFYLELPEA